MKPYITVARSEWNPMFYVVRFYDANGFELEDCKRVVQNYFDIMDNDTVQFLIENE